LYNDRFGFLACHNHHLNPIVICSHSSQKQAITKNLEANRLALLSTADPITDLEDKLDFVLLKIPKSLSEFRLYLQHISYSSTKDITVICGFMTRHFSPKLLAIGEEYFESVEQSKAVKKARLLILRTKKPPPKLEPIHSIDYRSTTYKQYWGVFSRDHIDYATQYFLEHVELSKTDQCILDLGSGNGVIANEIFKQLPESEIHLMDDSYLAIASSKLNIQGDDIYFHWHNNLSIFEDQQFDLIVSNPPFHFEYEINIQTTINLFKECERCLKEGGSLQLVANKHLNYKTHLKRIFSIVEIVSENEKFVIYKCQKQ
jgi:16S rRNA G1207 methylase RsmC